MSVSETKSNDRPENQRRARLGLLIPAVNSESEPQFNRYAPEDISVHVMRARIAPSAGVTLSKMGDTIRSSCDILCDVKPDLIVYHCTGSSMMEGRTGDALLVRMVHDHTGVATCSTIGLVVEAMEKLGMKKVVILSPYKSNQDAVGYLQEAGVETVHNVPLALASGAEFPAITPQQWVDLAVANDRADADGFFLSCTNTTQIEAIEGIEKATGKPVVNSNQAVLWGAAQRLAGASAVAKLPAHLGRLVRDQAGR